MSEIAFLALEIDSRPAAQAATDLDRLTGSAERTGRAADVLRVASGELVAALRENTAATSAMTRGMADIQSASARAQTAMTGVSTVTGTATTNVVQFDRSARTARAGLDEMTAAANRATGAWAALGKMGADTGYKLEVARRMASASAAPIAGGSPTGANGRLQGYQAQNLIYQGGDILSSLGSGSNFSTVALQQGPQIAQIFGGPGGASVRGALAQAGEGAVSLAARVGLVGGAIGGVTAVVGVGIAALASYTARQRETEQALLGVGRASGATLAQINAVADANARAGRISVGSAREYGATFAGTGRIDAGMAGSLITTTRDFAKVTGQDASDAAKDLAAAFADPAKGADALNARLGFLSDGVRENVRRLTEQGDRLGAQRVLFSAYKDSVDDVSRATSGWSALTAATGEVIGNTWDKIGRNISKGIFGGAIDQELVKAQNRLSSAQVASEGGFGLISSKDVETAQKDVDRLSGLIRDRDRKIEQAQRGQRSLEIGGIIRSLLPEQQEVERLTNQVERVRKAISDPVKFGLDGAALGQAEGAFGRISRLLQTMNDDVARFGTTAVAALNRTAEFNNRTVGYTPYGRSAAQVEQKYQDDLREKGLDPNGRSSAQVDADYRGRLGNVGLDLPDRYSLAQQRDAELQAAREREGYQRARDLELSTLRRTETLSLNPQGGAFSAMPAQVQQQVLEAGKLFGQVPAAIIAAIAKGESSGNANVGYSKSLGEDGRPSSAYGLGQITRGTAQEAITRGYLPQGYDRTDTTTMAQGIAAVLQMKIDQNGGDLTRGLEAYRGSRDPAVNRAYAAEAMRNAGQMGDASATGLVRDQDALTRAQRDAGQTLENLNQNYGRNGLALDTLQQRQAKHTELLDRGVAPIEAASVAFGGLIDKTVSLAQQAKIVQFNRDDDFAREQLGRSATDQRAYANARGMVGDTSSARAQGIIERTRETADLTEAKGMLTDGATSFATALRRGGDAADALSNAFGNAADKLISKALDSVISQGFGMLTKGGGGIASLFGFADGGYTGHGGRNQPAGIVHRGEVVWSQSDVARYGGAHVVNQMRMGYAGYAAGGPVGWSQPRMPAANSNGGGVTVNLIGAPAGTQVSEKPTPGGGREFNIDMLADRLEGRMAARASRSAGPLGEVITHGRALAG